MSAKVLFLDVETAPKRAFVWSMWKQNIGLNQLEADGFVLCWCAKWAHEKEVLSEALTLEFLEYEDDSKIMEKLWTLMDEADIIIGHNGDRFDIPTINARFAVHGMKPPSSYKTVDTLKIARRNFKFTSNRLDALGMFLGTGRKLQTGGFQLWADVMSGSGKAMNKMVRYCKQDVLLLERVYKKLRAWDNKAPNLAMYEDGTRPVCNCCGSKKVVSKGQTVTNSKIYKRWKCNSCGHNMRSPYAEKDKTRDQNRFISQ